MKIAPVRYGFMGGTFNPIHLGHIRMAEAAQKCCDLDKIFITPAFDPVHRQGEALASFADRVEMVRLATAEYPHFQPIFTDPEERISIRQTGNIWSHFYRQFIREASLYLILGLDQFYNVPQWKQAEEVLKCYNLAVIARPGCDMQNYGDFIRMPLLSPYSEWIDFVSEPVADISSTTLRERLAQGLPVSEYLHPAVERFIRERGLYRGDLL